MSTPYTTPRSNELSSCQPLHHTQIKRNVDMSAHQDKFSAFAFKMMVSLASRQWSGLLHLAMIAFLAACNDRLPCRPAKRASLCIVQSQASLHLLALLCIMECCHAASCLRHACCHNMPLASCCLTIPYPLHELQKCDTTAAPDDHSVAKDMQHNGWCRCVWQGPSTGSPLTCASLCFYSKHDASNKRCQ